MKDNNPITKTDGQITIDTIKAQTLIDKFLKKFRAIFEKTINSVRIPTLVDFFIKHPNDIDAAINDAPPAAGNWKRLMLGTFWIVFVPLIVVVILFIVTKAISILLYLVGMVVLLGFAYYLIKKMKAPKPDVNEIAKIE